MYRRVLFCIAGAVLLASWSPNANAQGAVLATGHGHWEYLGQLRIMSFTAQVAPDGTVRGQWQTMVRSLDLAMHIDINCATSVPGPENGDQGLVLGGTVTRSSAPALVGRHYIVGVYDNWCDEYGDCDDRVYGYLRWIDDYEGWCEEAASWYSCLDPVGFLCLPADPDDWLKVAGSIKVHSLPN